METQHPVFQIFPLLNAYGASYLHISKEEWTLVIEENDRYVFRRNELKPKQ